MSHSDIFDVNKPLDRLFLRIHYICSATNQTFALGYQKVKKEYNLTIFGKDKNELFEGNLDDINLQLTTVYSWHYCPECNRYFNGGYCMCQTALL